MKSSGVYFQRILTLVNLELSVLKAERWILVSALIFFTILTIELFLAKREYDNFRSKAESSQLAARQNWLNLGDRSPHGAAHHGTFLFKPVPVLIPFNPGLSPYLGTTIRAEAHVRHRLTNRPAENDIQPLRNSLTTPAELIQGVLPLLLILFGCGSISRERQQQTLPIIRSLGVPWWLFVLGKACALTLVAMGLAVPYLGGLIAATLNSWAAHPDNGLMLRAVLLFLSTLIYLLGWCCFIVAVSSKTRSAQMALVILLVFWAATTICLPSLTTNLVALASPPPSQEEFSQWSNQKKYGDDNSQNIFSQIRKDLEKEMLAKYQVDTVDELPFKFDGLLMMESEKVTDQFSQVDTDRLSSLLRTYENVVTTAAIVSPYLAVHHLTMTLAGTDERHHKHFDEVAEDYRRHLVLVVNRADSQKDSPTALRGEALWQSVKEFQYQIPTLRNISDALWFPITILLTWTIASLFLVIWIQEDNGRY